MMETKGKRQKQKERKGENGGKEQRKEGQRMSCGKTPSGWVTSATTTNVKGSISSKLPQGGKTNW